MAPIGKLAQLKQLSKNFDKLKGIVNKSNLARQSETKVGMFTLAAAGTGLTAVDNELRGEKHTLESYALGLGTALSCGYIGHRLGGLTGAAMRAGKGGIKNGIRAGSLIGLAAGGGAGLAWGEDINLLRFKAEQAEKRQQEYYNEEYTELA